MAAAQEDADQRLLRQDGEIRPDGRMVHDMYLMQVKTPAESKAAVGLLQGGRQAPGRRGLHDQGREQVRSLEVTNPWH